MPWVAVATLAWDSEGASPTWNKPESNQHSCSAQPIFLNLKYSCLAEPSLDQLNLDLLT